ncbi:hypothetical protein N9O57_01155 [bacterium]|nr:hypothetical protein [bacterium]
MMRAIVLICLNILLFSCVPQELPQGEGGDFSVALKWSEVQTSSDWDIYLRKALEEHGEDLMSSIPNDIGRFSKNYSILNYNQRLNFWAYLISMMAKKESNWRPETFYMENFNDNNGDNVISRGLLQISIESARGYDCPLNDANDLHDPEKNLICTVLILSRWVQRDKVISKQTSSGSWLGGARYWSVLRKESHLKYFTDDTLKLF